MPCFLLFNLLS